MVIYGFLECPLMDVGSKSEGRKAILTDDAGRKYKLYRKDVLPSWDEFFIPYSNQRIGVNGNEEPNTGSFLVHSMLLEDGREIFPQ